MVTPALAVEMVVTELHPQFLAVQLHTAVVVAVAKAENPVALIYPAAQAALAAVETAAQEAYQELLARPIPEAVAGQVDGWLRQVAHRALAAPAS
jgi:hypothetical protein